MREIDPAYKALEVDGMWYLALRNRGIKDGDTVRIREMEFEFSE